MGPNAITCLKLTSRVVWCVVRCGCGNQPENKKQKIYVIKRDWTMFSKFASHFEVNGQHGWDYNI